MTKRQKRKDKELTLELETLNYALREGEMVIEMIRVADMSPTLKHEQIGQAIAYVVGVRREINAVFMMLDRLR